MRRTTRLIASALVLGAIAAGGAVARSATASASNKNWFPEQVHLKLTPSSAQLAGCMPNVRVNVDVQLTTDRLGFDIFTVNAFNLPPNTTFTVFLLEKAGPPFGAAEYIGDFTSDRRGRSLNTFKLIVQEAFSSTLVNGVRTRVDLNQVGAWFADPKGDDFCLGPNSPVTPFDGDNEAGVQAFNSANTTPLPAP
ncbi:hypothetical protein ACPPVO_50555 [Dactylosporangium sp. McL0621]|uniref:hypothetical protein n=1 Tax=Dactylosporangium sp. McL0621 TaxID=3415678 RepID=UPI003CF0693C